VPELLRLQLPHDKDQGSSPPAHKCCTIIALFTYNVNIQSVVFGADPLSHSYTASH
jgi:hypothetical protein